MAITPARAAAYDILFKVSHDGAYAADLLHSTSLGGLSVADRALCTELVMGCLRWQSSLDSSINALATHGPAAIDLEVRIALRIGLYQMRHLERIPASAAVNESVELVKRAHKLSAASFANAVLRKLSARPQGMGVSGSMDADDLALDYAHPQWLVERWLTRYGAAATVKILAAGQQPPENSLRLWSEETATELTGEGLRLQPGWMLASARRVLGGEITHTAAFREGRASWQDEGSQLVALLAGHGKKILDCCAAPGGKTMVLASRNPEAEITACELHPHRAKLLAERMAYCANVKVITVDASQLTDELPEGELFDLILADVPCSGTGTLARNPEIKWKLTLDDIASLRARQLGILASVLRYLAPGGRLVYSTCSLEAEENESVVEEILAANKDLRPLPCEDELAKLAEFLPEDRASFVSGNYLRTLPGAHPCEGFFAAILVKE